MTVGTPRLKSKKLREENAIIRPHMRNGIGKALVEIGFIVFLFYSNLLMGEFERSGMGQTKGLLWALSDILTPYNFGIAIIAATIGYILIESLRTKF
jgi:hypothetical protein